MIKVEYLIDDDHMTEKEYEDQNYREFTITEDMIVQLINEHADLKRERGEHVVDITVLKS